MSFLIPEQTSVLIFSCTLEWVFKQSLKRDLLDGPIQIVQMILWVYLVKSKFVKQKIHTTKKAFIVLATFAYY